MSVIDTCQQRWLETEGEHYVSEYPTREKSILLFGEFCSVLFSLMKNDIYVPRIYCKAGGRCFSKKNA